MKLALPDLQPQGGFLSSVLATWASLRDLSTITGDMTMTMAVTG